MDEYEIPAVEQMAPPPGWPVGVTGRWEPFCNWSEEIDPSEPLWTATPGTGAQAALVCNWAAAQGRMVRAKGKAHNWAPFAFTDDVDPGKVVVLDTSALNSMAFVPAANGRPPSGRFGVGCTVGEVTEFLQQQTPGGFSFLNMTAPGELSLGGVLAIGGHGTGVPQSGEPALGGSMSNLILSVDAVVYDPGSRSYVERSFDRSDPRCAALAAHLGRALITRVSLAVVPDYALQCADVWGDDDTTYHGRGEKSFAALLAGAGRVEAIWWPFAWQSWIKVWRRTPSVEQPAVPGPYNYPWANGIPEWVSNAARQALLADPSLATTAIEGACLTAIAETGGAPLNGRSRDLLLYVKPDTLRYSMMGYALHVEASRVQAAVSAWTRELRRRLEAAEAAGNYPINGPIEIRVTSTDNAGPLGIPGAVSPLLSVTAPTGSGWSSDRVVLWVDLLTFPGTPGSAQFLADFEKWMWVKWVTFGVDAQALRPEWSKAWGYTAAGAWTADWIGTDLPAAYAGFARALAIFKELDPGRIFSSPLLDRLGL